MNKNETIELISNKKTWLAPLAGYTDKYYRQIAKLCGADVLVSEMVSADGLRHAFKRTKNYIEFYESERPYGVQLFGDDPETMQKACLKICDYYSSGQAKEEYEQKDLQYSDKKFIHSYTLPDFIDINMGCPVKKVVKRTAGSALMREPLLAEKIIKYVKEICDAYSLPLTVKIRAGWDLDSVNALEFAIMAQEAGADILTIHPRTRSQLFTGKSNWDIIKQVKERLTIPVVGNGDIVTPEDAKSMYEQTKCDSIMLGRGAIGNPWIFKYIKELIMNGYFKKDTSIERLPIILEHLNLIYESEDPKKLFQIRSHLAHYTKGLINSSKAREIIFQSLDFNLIKDTLVKLFNDKYI